MGYKEILGPYKVRCDLFDLGSDDTHFHLAVDPEDKIISIHVYEYQALMLVARLNRAYWRGRRDEQHAACDHGAGSEVSLGEGESAVQDSQTVDSVRHGEPDGQEP